MELSGISTINSFINYVPYGLATRIILFTLFCNAIVTSRSPQ